MVWFVRVVCLCAVRLRVACGVLCDVVWIVCVVFVCVGVLLICLCDAFIVYCVLSYGSCWCCCVFAHAGLNLFVRFVRDLLRNVV